MIKSFSLNRLQHSTIFIEQLNDEKVRSLKQISRISIFYYVTPLFLLFSLADWVFYRPLWNEFLYVRILTCIVAVLLCLSIQKTKTLFRTQVLCSFYIMACSLSINYMLFRIDDWGSPYYSGLILVIMGMASAFRFSRPFFVANITHCVMPLICATFVFTTETLDFRLLNLLFLGATVLIMSVSKLFWDSLYEKEFDIRSELSNEISNREKIIEDKTEEGLKLSHLTKQFSPQIVQHIMSDGEDLLKPKIETVCVIFADIVGSTQKISLLSPHQLNKAISVFLSDISLVFLKYDLTIDKFLGDGILAFCNSPVLYENFVERVAMAAIDVQRWIQGHEKEYQALWNSKVELSIGIATGEAIVGFFGNDNSMKTYTALGHVVNLASRLSDISGANKIAVCQKTFSILNNGSYDFTEKEHIKLKGIEESKSFFYRLIASRKNSLLSKTTYVCPLNHGALLVEQTVEGVFILKCGECDYEQKEIPVLVDKKSAA